MKKVRIGVIPAAGIGRRMTDLPLTRILPKPLLPILHKPIIEYGINNMKRIGVENLYLIVGFKKELFKEYLGDGSDFGVHIEYILQPNPSGIAAAVELTQDLINEPFAIILGDDLTLAKSIDNLVNDFWAKHAKIVEGVVFEKDIEKLKRTCCVNLNENGEMLEIIEKPNIVTSQLRGCGVYICDPMLYDFISKTPYSATRGEREITDTINLMAQERCAYGSLIDGKNININKFSDLIDAMQLLLAQQQS